MARFEPFPGVRYDPARVALADVVAPPYDVIGRDEQRRLEERSPYNVVHVDLAPDRGEGDRYHAAAARLERWRHKGILVADGEAGFYLYRMGYRDEAGLPRQTAGVIGALELSPSGGDVLPHERTMAKPKDDRLNLMRASDANLSPIWGLSLAPGLAALCEVPGPPVARCTDDDGVHHRLWRITEPGRLEALAETVASAPVVIADGHHRYETALAYRDERREAEGGRRGGYDLILAYIVELAADQLTVGPIHRALSGLPADFDPVAALAPGFDAVARMNGTDAPASGRAGRNLAAAMAEAEALAVVDARGAWLLRPRGEAAGASPPSDAGNPDAGYPDATLLDGALREWPPHQVAYHHTIDDVVADVDAGRAQLGLLLRAPSVGQIAAAAAAGRRMPEKTSFFSPKPRTGMVFRRLSH